MVWAWRMPCETPGAQSRGLRDESLAGLDALDPMPVAVRDPWCRRSRLPVSLDSGLSIDGRSCQTAPPHKEVAHGWSAQRGADQMHDGGLQPGVREGRLDRLREAPEAVDAGDQHVGDGAAARVVEHRQPELGALGLLPPDAQDRALTIASDAQGELAGEVAHRAVLAHLHAQRVEVDNWIDRLQRPGAARLDVLEHGVGHP